MNNIQPRALFTSAGTPPTEAEKIYNTFMNDCNSKLRKAKRTHNITPESLRGERPTMQKCVTASGVAKTLAKIQAANSPDKYEIASRIMEFARENKVKVFFLAS